MKQIQFIQVTPEQLKEAIIDGVKTQLDNLKTHFAPKEPTEYLTRKEVSDLFKVDISTIHNWTVKGILKAYSIGRRVYYKRDEIELAIVELEK
jgi:hypothetical protein